MSDKPGKRMLWLFLLTIIVWLHFGAFMWIFYQNVVNNDTINRVSISNLLIPLDLIFAELIVFILVNIFVMVKDLYYK